MNKTFEKLSKKYGAWETYAGYKGSCHLLKYSESMFLHVIFDPDFNSVAELKRNKIHVGKELSIFYKECNGVTLYSHSFVLYGSCLQTIKGYSPLDLNSINKTLRLKYKNWDDSYFSIGRYYKYEFCVKKHSLRNVVFIVDRTTGKTLSSFKNINMLIEHVVSSIDGDYGANGLKASNKFSSKNWMDNMSNKDIF